MGGHGGSRGDGRWLEAKGRAREGQRPQRERSRAEANLSAPPTEGLVGTHLGNTAREVEATPRAAGKARQLSSWGLSFSG